MSATQRPRCKGKTWGGYYWHACRNKASTDAGYCKRCDPALKHERQKAIDAKWKALANQRDREEAARQAMEARKVEAHEAALALARAVLKIKPIQDRSLTRLLHAEELARTFLELSGEKT